MSLLVRRCSLLVRVLVLCVGAGVWAGSAAAQDRQRSSSDRRRDPTRILTSLGRHRDTIDTFQPQPYQLRPFVLPGSETIWVGSTRLDTSEYRLDSRSGRLWVQRDDLLGARDTLFAQYRTYPFRFEDVYRRRAPDTSTAADSTVAVVEEEDPASTGFDPFEGVDIQRSGSISRGVVAGTQRDARVESGLRMQLQGEVADSVFVRALLTDENTPIQPQGTTQRLQDFDRVFLEIDAPQGRARLGDVDVNLNGGTFGHFTQKVQGAALQTKRFETSGGAAGGKLTAFGAVSRGQFRTQDIKPRDGVQGPYRLRGKNGEDAIIVIAGSERVYLDGERLTRGRTEDYVIDYTQAEITFTPNRLITADRRITVEFQYSTTQFTRTLVGGRATAKAWQGRDGESRLQLGATVVRQADGRDFQTAFDLSRQDSLRLVRAGDQQAVRSGARRVEFDPDAPFVHYRQKVITTPDGQQDSIFVALEEAPPSNTPVFRVRFTRVGRGNGAYERAGKRTNGVVYEYVGSGKGAYLPVQPLPAPTKQRLVDLTGSVEPVPGLEVFGEWAGSLNDENRFSSRDAGDDEGRAYSGGLRLQPQSLEVGGVSLGTVSGTLRRRNRGANFVTFDQTRSVEYGRRWNLSRSGSDLPARLQGRGGETIDRGQVSVDWGDGSRLEAGLGRLSVGSAFEAWRRRGTLSIEEEGWPQVSLRTVSITSTDRPARIDGSWVRQEATLRHSFRDGHFVPRVSIERERRRQEVQGTDSLTTESFRFLEVRPGVSYKAGALRAQGSLEYRTEDGEANGSFRDASRAWTAQTELTYAPSSPYRVSIRGGLRSRQVTDYFRRNERRRDTESVILRLEGRARPLDRAVDAQIFYDAATERTPILRELYVQTKPERGQYVWRDSNGDGVQQIDEFVPETTPNEGTYVQRFVPSDTLESVVDLQARTRLTLRPRRLWSDADRWWREWLSHVTTETRIEVQEKSRTDAPAEIYQLNLDRFRRPGETIDGSLQMEQRVELFRTQREYGIDVSWRQKRGLTERAAGAERRFLNQWTVEGEFWPAPAWSVQVEGTVERDRVKSEAFDKARSYDIRTLRVRPSLSFQPERTLDVTLSGLYARKRDRAKGRRADLFKFPLEITWRRAGRLRLSANVELAHVDLNGTAVGRAQFELTDGRGPGTSLLWGMRGQYNITDNLRATVNYDGRAPSTTDPIHTVRVQVSASF
ncbi:MAG: hypothetical protein ABEL51_00165 [Salinibacter sp.]